MLRRCIFRPFLKGKGPVFTLSVRHAGYASNGRDRLAYELWMVTGRQRVRLFEGDQFQPSPLDAIDSDAAIAALMGFLTLRPGDTDREYFDGYTAEQLEYCARWAEALYCEVESRFGSH